MTKTLTEQATALIAEEPKDEEDLVKDPPTPEDPPESPPLLESIIAGLKPTIIEAVSTIVKDSIQSMVTGQLQGELKLMDTDGNNKISLKEFLNSDFLKYTIVSILSMMCGQFISWIINWAKTGSIEYQPFANLLIDFGGYLILMVLFKSILDRHNKETKEKNIEIKTLEKTNANLTKSETVVVDKYERKIDHNQYIADVQEKQLLNALEVKNTVIEMMRLGFDPNLANQKLAEQYGETPIHADVKPTDTETINK